MKQIDCLIIGIANHSEVILKDEVKALIDQHTVFSGGKRHYKLVKQFLPVSHQWIEISGKMTAVMGQYQKQKHPIVVFASGDPLFFGIANTIKRLLPQANIKVFPYFNALQLLAHKALINYSELHTISLHGRHSWKALDKALIQGHKSIGILTDQEYSPTQIAKRLMTYQFNDYDICVGEDLDGKEENISCLSLEEASQKHNFHSLNCVILQKKSTYTIPKSFVDSSYQTLEGRPGMITKQAFRLLSLNALNLYNRSCFWDIGTCTGAIAIEAKLNFPDLDVLAFEKREACETIISTNTQTHFCPGIQVQIADFFELDLKSYQQPDAIFIGGHGNRLEEMIHSVNDVLKNDGIIVMNTVLESSYHTFLKVCKALDYHVEEPSKIHLNNYNTIHILVAQKG